MPDGDKFFRRLIGTGKGWGTVYRIACNNASLDILKDKVMKACADNLRRISPDSVEEVINVLHNAFQQEKWQRQGLPVSIKDTYLKLEYDLRVLKIKGEYNLGVILEKSIKKVFLANRNSSISITKQEINEKLGQTLAIEIMDSRCLSRIRDGIMEKQNRTMPEQIKWEQELRREIIVPAQKMIKNFLNGKQTKKFRAPIARKVKRDSTSNILNRSLAVLPSA